MQAFQAAVRGAPLDVALGILARAATKQWDNGVRCGFYRVNRDGTELHHVSGMGESYAECVDSFKVGSNSLACGLAVHTGCPVITPDVLNDPLWQPWLWLAKEYNFRGCWSFPVETEERRVVGTLVCLHRSSRNAKGHHRAAASRDRQDAGAAGDQGAHGRAWLRGGRQYAWRVRGSIEGRERQMGKDHSRRRHQGSLTRSIDTAA